MESSDAALTEYNQLRASVGMAPAADDDYYEYVAWVVIFDLDAPEVADESKRLPVEQQGLFLMTYATYLYWLAMKGVESKFPPNSWRLVAPLLERELSKQPWYQPEVMNRLLIQCSIIRRWDSGGEDMSTSVHRLGLGPKL